ncbi:MAG: hypothetical protein JW828_15785 [Sedimentisphaerales bacterium]|nr:hypothetical protein [Sedimentisphaerales bacterium]
MRIALILLVIFAAGCTVEEQSRRETVIDKLKDLYPDAWRQMLVQFNLLKSQQPGLWSDEEILLRLCTKYPPQEHQEHNTIRPDAPNDP